MSKEQSISVQEFDFNTFTKSQVIKSAVQTAFELNMPLAIWRLPHSNEIHFITSSQPALKPEKVELAELNKGFIFSKFSKEPNNNYFIAADYHLSFDYNEVVETKSKGENTIAFQAHLKEKMEAQHEHTSYFTSDYAESESVEYTSLVSRAIEAIKSGHFEKVVPARSKDVALSENFDVVELFLRLTDTYDNAFISFVSIPEVGSWMGATPEVLIEQEKSTFRTVSLAGTKRFDEDTPISETAWNQKEIEEQAMVSRFIINCFKKIRLREFTEKGPKTAKAGNLLHLKTVFEVNMDETNFAELPTVMLDLLHPTSAVAGMPKEPAIDFIKTYEGLDRGFYSGFLGPVGMDNSTHVFVNLRCMQLFKDHVRLYAGAGVTEDSDPKKEYLETEMKCNTLLNKIIHRV